MIHITIINKIFKYSVRKRNVKVVKSTNLLIRKVSKKSTFGINLLRFKVPKS